MLVPINCYMRQGRMGEETMAYLLRLSLVSVLLFTSTSTEVFASDKNVAKKNLRQVHTYSSVRPYLAHALRDCRCYEVRDAFDARACKKGCKKFKKKMLKWASKHSVLNDSLDIDVSDYNFRSKSFALNLTESITPEVRFGRVDQDGIIIGSSRCDTIDGELTSMVETSHKLTVRMSEEKARKSMLRNSDSVSSVAILKGKPSSITWCCGAWVRRDFAMDKVPCKGRVFKYAVKELALGFDPVVDPEADSDESEEPPEGAWKLGFKTRVVAIEFSPDLLGMKEVPGSLER
jgi:hypothetical protein